MTARFGSIKLLFAAIGDGSDEAYVGLGGVAVGHEHFEPFGLL